MYWNAGVKAYNDEPVWLTLTWDVLKLRMIQCNSFSKYRLTLTWDVLK